STTAAGLVSREKGPMGREAKGSRSAAGPPTAPTTPVPQPASNSPATAVAHTTLVSQFGNISLFRGTPTAITSVFLVFRSVAGHGQGTGSGHFLAVFAKNVGRDEDQDFRFLLGA